MFKILEIVKIVQKCNLEKLSNFEHVSFFDASHAVSFQYNSE